MRHIHIDNLYMLTIHVQLTIANPCPRASWITQELPNIVPSFLISYHTLHNSIRASRLLLNSSFPFRPSKSSQRLQILIHPSLGPDSSTKRHSRNLKKDFELRRQAAVDAR